MMVVTLLTLAALTASILGPVPAEAQASSPSSISLTAVDTSVRAGQKAGFEITVSPALAVDTEVTVLLRVGGGEVPATVVDLAASGFTPRHSRQAERTYTVAAGQSNTEVVLDTLPSARPQTMIILSLGVLPTSLVQPSSIPATVPIASPPPGSRTSLNDVLPDGVDVGAAAGPAAITTVDEGDTLQFGVFLAQPPAEPVTAIVSVNFASRSNIDAASPADLVDNGQILPGPNGEGFFVQVPLQPQTLAVPVRIPTALDMVVPEGDADGIERFQVQVVALLNSAGAAIDPSRIAFGDPLTLEIRDPESVGRERRTRPNRTRAVVAAPIVVPTPDPIQGPLVAGSIRSERVERTVTLHIPPALHVWLSPNSKVRVLSNGSPIATIDDAPHSIVVDFDGATESGRPDELVFQGRLRNGAVYTETVPIS